MNWFLMLQVYCLGRNRKARRTLNKDEDYFPNRCWPTVTWTWAMISCIGVIWFPSMDVLKPFLIYSLVVPRFINTASFSIYCLSYWGNFDPWIGNGLVLRADPFAACSISSNPSWFCLQWEFALTSWEGRCQVLPCEIINVLRITHPRILLLK